MLTLVGGNVSRVADAAHAKVECRRLDEAGVLYGVGAHLVVQMGHTELQGKRLAKLAEHM